MIISRLKGENGCNWREKEYVQPCVEAKVCPFIMHLNEFPFDNALLVIVKL